MNLGIYYHVLSIGILYEKGGKKGRFWRYKERKRLQEECNLWNKIMFYISEEKRGIDCSENFFNDLQNICKKNRLPNYERVLKERKNIEDSENVIVIVDVESDFLNKFITELLNDFKAALKNFYGKKDAYIILEALHNLPKVFYGRDELGSNKPLTCDDAVKYAGWAMSDEMKSKYKMYIC